jgi:hypothetical protein
MWQVLDAVFLGDRDDASDLKLLKSFGITHVVNCAGELPCRFPQEFCYLPLHLKDPDERFQDHIRSVCQFVDNATRNGRVLVHCSAGVSRSAAAVLAYLCHRGATLEAAARRLSEAVLTAPDASFIEQIASHLGRRLSRDEVERISLVLLGRR